MQVCPIKLIGIMITTFTQQKRRRYDEVGGCGGDARLVFCCTLCFVKPALSSPCAACGNIGVHILIRSGRRVRSEEYPDNLAEKTLRFGGR